MSTADKVIRRLVREIIHEQAVVKPPALDKSRLSSTSQGYMNEPSAQGLTPTEKLTYAAARGMAGVDPTAAKYAATHPKEGLPKPKGPVPSAWRDGIVPGDKEAMLDLVANIGSPGKSVPPEKLQAQAAKPSKTDGQLATALAAAATDKKFADTIGPVARAVKDGHPVTKPIAQAAVKSMEKVTPDDVANAAAEVGVEVSPEDAKKGVDAAKKIADFMKSASSKMK